MALAARLREKEPAVTPEDIAGMWRRINELRQTDPAEAERTERIHYVSVLVAIANDQARPDPESLARAVLRHMSEARSGGARA